MTTELDDIFGTATVNIVPPHQNNEKRILAPGIYADIPARDYHQNIEGVSNSYLSKLNRCPAAAKIEDDDTAAMAFGRAVHCLALEGETAFFSGFAVAPSGIDRRTSKGKTEWAEFQAATAGKELVSVEDFETMNGMREAVHRHPFASEILSAGKAEQTVIWKDPETGIICKCRPDWIPAERDNLMARIMADLKSTEDASEAAFEYSIKKYGYARQGGMYLDGTNTVRRILNPEGIVDLDIFAFIAVEKKKPFRVEVHVLESCYLEYGVGEYRRLLRLEAQCRKQNKWPHYTNSGAHSVIKPAYLV